ncbi:acyltransferase family protein [Pseudoalteromonas agarivorans]|uniref:acyltransferase family protein n=1 Tax=Pseudoalteromonas agarivorans TaxID=176102 RepID=UPI0003D6206C|nr:acyltransferase family protein [Pseudoalteromonas agarivorans]ETJ48373.1 hypothetical protein X564_09550 [Pseudoalteromonas agarivorans]
MSTRNINYDLIRLLGLLIIMVAHSSPPGWIFQLRNFGTPLLVVGSGLTYSLIFASRKLETKAFYKKRLPKLIFPAWLFLTFFFLSVYAASIISDSNFPFPNEIVIESFLFMGGIGFVWVFKIYIILSLITPLAVYLNDKVNNNLKYLSSLLFLYIVYEIAVYLITPLLTGVYSTVFNSIIFITLPYTILFLYAFNLPSLKKASVVYISMSSLIVFIVLAYLKYTEAGHFVHTQLYKYPPTLYYLSYAFFAVNAIYLTLTNIKVSNDFTKSIVIWLSSNSLWVYLWHIFAFYIWKFASIDQIDMIVPVFVGKIFFMIAFGIIFTQLQNILLNRLPIENTTWKTTLLPLLTNKK